MAGIVTNPTSRWLGIYLFYNEPWEAFIVNAIHPLVELLRKESIIEHFFFIRYWERGPHIRLRLKVKYSYYNQTLRNRLRNYFEEYFRKYPSGHEGIQADSRIFPNNSIKFTRYYPEIKRYGGEHCIQIAEQQFELSSYQIMRKIALCNEWSYEMALGVAIKLHLGMIHSMKLTDEEASAFFSILAVSLTQSFYTKSSFIQEDPLSLYVKIYSEQQSTLIQYCSHFWHSLNVGLKYKDDLRSWHDGMKNIHMQLVKKQRSNLYQIPEKFILSCPKSINSKTYKLLYIYQSFIHMTNNRLGIKNHDEGYIAFLLMKFFQKNK